ncbi:MAG: hypothetical protein Q7S64_01370 [bacterium]|nr:hypothetical protein [bacterium]
MKKTTSSYLRLYFDRQPHEETKAAKSLQKTFRKLLGESVLTAEADYVAGKPHQIISVKGEIFNLTVRYDCVDLATNRELGKVTPKIVQQFKLLAAVLMLTIDKLYGFTEADYGDYYRYTIRGEAVKLLKKRFKALVTISGGSGYTYWQKEARHQDDVTFEVIKDWLVGRDDQPPTDYDHGCAVNVYLRNYHLTSKRAVNHFLGQLIKLVKEFSDKS